MDIILIMLKGYWTGPYPSYSIISVLLYYMIVVLEHWSYYDANSDHYYFRPRARMHTKWQVDMGKLLCKKK